MAGEVARKMLQRGSKVHALAADLIAEEMFARTHMAHQADIIAGGMYRALTAIRRAVVRASAADGYRKAEMAEAADRSAAECLLERESAVVELARCVDVLAEMIELVLRDSRTSAMHVKAPRTLQDYVSLSGVLSAVGVSWSR